MKYKFVKPNDRNALDLMNAAAVAVMKELPDLVLAYGNSDEFRYVAISPNKLNLESATAYSKPLIGADQGWGRRIAHTELS